MKIKNKDVEEIALFLLDFKLKGVENRRRNKFFKMLQSHLRELQEEHKQLLEEYCNKNEDGSLKTLEDDGRSLYDIQDVEGFQKEYEKLMEEYLYVPTDESFSTVIGTVKKIVLNCDKEFSGAEALKYETICELFEDDSIPHVELV